MPHLDVSIVIIDGFFSFDGNPELPSMKMSYSIGI